MPLPTIKDATIAVTYRCNSRCRMCNIWQKCDHSGEILPEAYEKLPTSLLHINITGGEPFLREDLVEIASVIIRRCPNADIIISSNGFAVDLIKEKVRRILELSARISVAISMDGIGEKHNRIRGVANGYNRSLAAITSLKAMGVKVKIAFTLGNYNVRELQAVYQLADFFGLEFSMAVVHSSENYFSKYNEIIRNRDIENAIFWLIQRELQTNDCKRWGRAYFAHGIAEFLKKGHRILPDYSGILNVFIDPCGNIYPNNVSDKPIGRLEKLEDGFNNLESANKNNWMMCTARAAIKKHWIRAGWWVLWNK